MLRIIEALAVATAAIGGFVVFAVWAILKSYR